MIVKPNRFGIRGAMKDIAYGVAETATLGRGIKRNIAGNALRFPAKFSRFYPNDYEPHTFDFLRRNCAAGAVCIDIGAHLGLFSVMLARWAGKTGHVYAFEPTASSRDCIQRMALLNCVSNRITIKSEAVSSSAGRAEFYVNKTDGCNANSLLRQNSDTRPTPIVTVSVDSFVDTITLRPTILKIDAEGAEEDILDGAKGTLADYRPSIWLALHPPILNSGALGRIWDVVSEQNYRIESRIPMTRAVFAEQTGLFDVGLVPAV